METTIVFCMSFNYFEQLARVQMKRKVFKCELKSKQTVYCWHQPTISLEMPVLSQGHCGFHSFRLLTDFVCLYNYEFGLSLCKIVRSSVILVLPLLSHSVSTAGFFLSVSQNFLVRYPHFNVVSLHHRRL